MAFFDHKRAASMEEWQAALGFWDGRVTTFFCRAGGSEGGCFEIRGLTVNWGPHFCLRGSKLMQMYVGRF